MQDQIGSIVQAMSVKFDAKKIILFGSQAYGQPDEDSDVDLCVIADTKGKRKIDILREIRRGMASQISAPLDMLIYDEEEFNERACLNSTLEHKILTDGIVIYG